MFYDKNNSSINSLKKQRCDYFQWCKELKTIPTIAEKKAKELFKTDNILNHFIPQVPIFINQKNRYIMDFFSLKHLMSIEIDGIHHYYPGKQYGLDKKRTARLEMIGIWTVRIGNDFLLQQPTQTIQQLKTLVTKRKKTRRERKWLKAGQPIKTINRILKLIEHNKTDYGNTNIRRIR